MYYKLQYNYLIRQYLTMPFTTASATIEGKKGGIASVAVKQNLWDFIASGGQRQYAEKLEKLEKGTKLTQPEKEFMDRVERLFPYTKGKRGNVDSKGDTIPTNINILQTNNDDLLKILKEGSPS